jgi:hypothetical protein
MGAFMADEVIAHMRDRIARTRRIIDMAHDPRMIQMLEDLIAEAEVDIKRLEGEQSDVIHVEIRDAPPRG